MPGCVLLLPLSLELFEEDEEWDLHRSELLERREDITCPMLGASGRDRAQLGYARMNMGTRGELYAIC